MTTRKQGKGRKGETPDSVRAREGEQMMKSAIINLHSGLKQYADGYKARFEGALVGDDGVLGVYWHAVACGVVGLLNGPCGDLDCGAADAGITRTAWSAGDKKELVTPFPGDVA